MLKDVEKKFARIQVILLAVFGWGLGFLYLVSTILFDRQQMRWELIGFAWESLLLAVPIIVVHPLFRPLTRGVGAVEDRDEVSDEEATRLLQLVLSYPFKASVFVFATSLAAFALVALQVRYFAALPWEGVFITVLSGFAAALLWAVLEYHLLEYYLRPLTALVLSKARQHPPVGRHFSLAFKIFAAIAALVLSSLSFFGVAAYARAARTLEQESGVHLSGRLRELADLMGQLPRNERGEISDSWRWVAAEFRISPRGYFHLVDPSGRVLATHPVTSALDIARLSQEELRPATRRRILSTSEGTITDRRDWSKLVSFVSIPNSNLKLVAIAPMHDLSPQLDQLLYSGLTAMAFAIVLSLAVGLLCARSITTSLGAVSGVAREVAEHRDLGQRVQFATNDEVGVLARSFNRMAEEIQEYAGSLETGVAERTRELAERSRELEEKNHELSDFLYVASHDLRAPLINLDGFSHALRDSLASLEDAMARPNGLQTDWPALKGEIDESLEFILSSVAKMDLLVKSLLELSRIEARPQARQPIDTDAMLKEILASLRYQIEAKSIRVSTEPLPPIVGDPVRMSQVFTNLIDNAIKYMPERAEPRIEVGCEENGAAYRFFVRDNGAGIRPEDRHTVFRLFTRLVPGGGVPGDGVGLTAVKKIVEKHGGRVWLDSEVGLGTTFWFTLPREGTAEKHDPAERKSAAPIAA
jgi:signal transduction histidine kinase